MVDLPFKARVEGQAFKKKSEYSFHKDEAPSY